MTQERCPCCRQTISPKPKPLRECYDCGNPISRTHKYTYQERPGVPVPVTVHRVCSNPTGYYPPRESRRLGVVGFKHMTDEELEAVEARAEELERQFAQFRLENGRLK